MQRKQSLGTVSRILAIMGVTLILANSGWARVNKTLYTFTGGVDGNAPSALIFDGAGNLYGTTPGGGPGACQNLDGCGTVFELMHNADGTWTKKVLYEFMGGVDGAYPQAGLVFDGTGNLYGTTEGGGAYVNNCAIGPGLVLGCGLIFELLPNSNGTWTESVLYSFAGNQDGAFPLSGLISDGAGNFYGTTLEGGGVIGIAGVAFKLSPSTSGWTESVLYIFARYYSPGSLIFDSAGNLYGTTSGQGAYGNVFWLTPNPTGYWTRHVLHRFTGGNDGASPASGLIFDSAGNLYGATSGGGAFGYGNVFRFTPNLKGGWSEHVLHQFTGGTQGGSPGAGLTLDAAGNLYGTTYHGGNLSNCSGGCGVAFELTPTAHGWKESVLWSFANHPGAYPAAVPVLDTAGNLYGTTTGDGITTQGSVFEITP
jgi:uncharacterized repeat protein (TIGR03803 family)